MNTRFFKSVRLLNSLIFVIVLTTQVFSQPIKGMYGITTTISKGFVSSSNISTNNGSLNIGMAYMPSDRISVRAELGFRSQTDTSTAKNSEFTFTGNVWYYLRYCRKYIYFFGWGTGIWLFNGHCW